MKRKRVLIKFVTLLVACLAILNIIMYFLQPSMLFMPYREIEATPESWGMHYSPVEIKTEDNVKLHGWFIPAKGSNKVILFSHGNAGNISNRGDSIKIFHELVLNVLIFDYRGYGKSEGHPHEQGLYKDAYAAWIYLIEKKGYEKENIILFGRSLGGAVAMWLAVKVQARFLILESTFSSFRDMASTQLPIISRLLVARYRFKTASRVSKFTGRLLVVHSVEDEIVPYKLAKKIFNAAAEPKTFLTISGGHNEGFMISQETYKNGLKQFISNREH